MPGGVSSAGSGWARRGGCRERGDSAEKEDGVAGRNLSESPKQEAPGAKKRVQRPKPRRPKRRTVGQSNAAREAWSPQTVTGPKNIQGRQEGGESAGKGSHKQGGGNPCREPF